MRQTAACKKRNVRTASQETITCAFCTRSVLFQQQHIRGINRNFIHDFCDLRVISSTFDHMMLQGRIECSLRHLIIWNSKGELNAVCDIWSYDIARENWMQTVTFDHMILQGRIECRLKMPKFASLWWSPSCASCKDPPVIANCTFASEISLRDTRQFWFHWCILSIGFQKIFQKSTPDEVLARDREITMQMTLSAMWLDLAILNPHSTEQRKNPTSSRLLQSDCPQKNGWLLGSDPEPFLLPAAPWELVSSMILRDVLNPQLLARCVVCYLENWCSLEWKLQALFTEESSSPARVTVFLEVVQDCRKLPITSSRSMIFPFVPDCCLERAMTDESRKRARPNILVAGTPGTKKTSTCSLLASATALRHINVGE